MKVIKMDERLLYYLTIGAIVSTIFSWAKEDALKDFIQRLVFVEAANVLVYLLTGGN